MSTMESESTPTETTVSSASKTTQTREETLRECLFEAGFDIFHGPFAPSVYNDLLESEGLVQSGLLSKLPEDMTSAGTSSSPSTTATAERKFKTQAYLIGNTKHLWPIFLRWLHREHKAKVEKENSYTQPTDDNALKKEPTEILIEHPLDTYEQSTIREIVERICGCGSDIGSDGIFALYWSSDIDPSRMVSMARIASVTGFSYLDPYTHLSVHPKFGTWHSYRAVLLLPAEESSSSSLGGENPLPLLPNPMSALDERAAKEAFDRALDISTGKPKTTESPANAKEGESSSILIDEEDRSKLSEELGRGNYQDDEAPSSSSSSSSSSLSAKGSEGNRKTKVSNAWIALREAISIGRDTYRFGEDQLQYHYTKDPTCLWKGIEALNLGDATTNTSSNAKPQALPG